MLFLQLLLVLGLAFFAHAACRKPTPMKNYSQKKFSGIWYGVAYNLLNNVDDEMYKLSSCPFLAFDNGVDGNKWQYYALNGSSPDIKLAGTFKVPDPNLGFLKDTTEGLFGTYECTVLCSDYTTYAAAYSCIEVSPEHTTEWIQLHVRDVSQYDEVIAKLEQDNCYAGLPIQSAKDLTVRPYTNCKGNVYNLLGSINKSNKGLSGTLVYGL